MTSDAITLPTGYRFRPTDEELVVDYLQRKVFNLQLPCNVIKEIELYNYHPSEIGISGEEVDNKSYFFTRPEHKGKRPNRIAKNGGHWKASSKTDVWDSKNKKIGTKRSLVFMSSKKEKSNWLMDEYKVGEVNDWVLCCVYEHINAEEKKKRKERAVGSSISISENVSSEEIGDHDQSRPRKRQERDAASKDEETPYCWDIIEWNEEEFKLLQSLCEELPQLLELEPPMQGIPSPAAQVYPSLSGHPTSSITGANMNEGRTYDVGPSSFNGPDHISSSISQGSWNLPGPHLTSSITGGDMKQGQIYDVGPSSFNVTDHISSSISLGSSLLHLPGPHPTGSITGGNMNLGDQPYDVGPSAINGPDHFPSSISQGSSLWHLSGPQPTVSITGGNTNLGDQPYGAGPLSVKGPDHNSPSI